MSWHDPEEEDTTIYKVVVNHEEQYSIWPADRENPLGWQDAGKSGPKAECLSYIEEVWTDMRPLSLRKRMEEEALRGPDGGEGDESPAEPEEDDLVERLSRGDQPVEVSLHPEKDLQALKESLERGYVHIKFTGTRGGTELGVKLDAGSGGPDEIDSEGSAGTLHLEGGLTLNYKKVRCIADIDLKTFEGRGRLEPV
ncbi:MAG TPA: MbtH family protein [Pyrinomonadaceae bacterium]